MLQSTASAQVFSSGQSFAPVQASVPASTPPVAAPTAPVMVSAPTMTVPQFTFQAALAPQIQFVQAAPTPVQTIQVMQAAPVQVQTMAAPVNSIQVQAAPVQVQTMVAPIQTAQMQYVIVKKKCCFFHFLHHCKDCACK
jgi:hypothetical protein